VERIENIVLFLFARVNVIVDRLENDPGRWLIAEEIIAMPTGCCLVISGSNRLVVILLL
jgi:hypothetical protein